jgi:Protein of unknown function (DUF3043)
VRVLGRRTPKDPASPQNGSDKAAVPGPRTNGSGASGATGKGRPTPKRNVAEKRRAPITAPTNRRDAARQSREKRAVKRNDARKALVSGDERVLPARDRGPLRRYIRDWADSKRTLAEFLLPLLVLFWLPTLFVKGSTRTTFSVALTAVVLVIMFELVVMISLLRRAVNREFPANAPGRRGAIAYGAMRLASIRMLRLPKPAVKRGSTPRPIR